MGFVGAVTSAPFRCRRRVLRTGPVGGPSSAPTCAMAMCARSSASKTSRHACDACSSDSAATSTAASGSSTKGPSTTLHRPRRSSSRTQAASSLRHRCRVLVIHQTQRPHHVIGVGRPRQPPGTQGADPAMVATRASSTIARAIGYVERHAEPFMRHPTQHRAGAVQPGPFRPELVRPDRRPCPPIVRPGSAGADVARRRLAIAKDCAPIRIHATFMQALGSAPLWNDATQSRAAPPMFSPWNRGASATIRRVETST